MVCTQQVFDKTECAYAVGAGVVELQLQFTEIRALSCPNADTALGAKINLFATGESHRRRLFGEVHKG